MIIAIYSSRIVLQALGIKDFGVYNVVGGMVSMLGIVSNALVAAISRFITYEIGRGNKERLQQLFATSKIVLYVLASIVFVIAEILGIWFLYTQMQIPNGRITAAMWVLQCSIITFVINMMAIPYNACVIAHEHMNVYAYISIFDALSRLCICFFLLVIMLDKLITYAVLMMLLSLIVRGIYVFYCNHHFEESLTKAHYNKSIYNELFGFAGWSFFTSANGVLSTQGVNILINVFFGVVFNAARGIANQVQNALSQFVSSFVSAINPQITKSYAAGDIEAMHSLVCRGARFSYYLTLMMVIPVFFETETILNIWLTEVPPKAIVFTQLSLINILIDGAGYTSYTANLATGKIKKYSIVLSSITFFIFPLSWLAYSWGGAVELSYFIAIFANILYHLARLYLTQENVGLRAVVFIKEVYYPVLKTTFFAVLPLYLINEAMPPTYGRFFISFFCGVGMSISMAFIFGMKRAERQFLLSKMNSVITFVIGKFLK